MMENNKINIEHVIQGCNSRLDDSVEYLYDRAMEHAENLHATTADTDGFVSLVKALGEWKKEAKGE